MSKKIEIEIPEGKRAEWQEIDGKTILVAVDEVDNRPVTERIKKNEEYEGNQTTNHREYSQEGRQ